jgi:cytochrome c oxidase cbb3-type subunit I/II
MPNRVSIVARPGRAVLGAVALLLAVAAAGVQAQERGQKLYAEHCAACHGAKGDGEGPGAYILAQRPRNFTLGVFKYRSTPSGQPPTDDDLLRTITHGLAGANGAQMPSFASLPEADRLELVGVVKRFAEFGAPGKAITVPPEPRAPNLKLGAAVYDRLQCANCHGGEGRGDGESSTTLKDDDKRRIWAPDLTRGRYKRGDSPQDTYLAFATGIDGSPMPSYAGKATPQELWALTHYVRSLAKRAPAVPQR